MKRFIVAVAVLSVAGVAQAALIAADNGSNYAGGWTNTANGGYGFNPWSITAGTAGGFSGSFIGDPAGAGISGMSNSTFGLFANPYGPGNFVTADRSFAAALNVGDIFALQWGVNWDSDGLGNKGFNLYSGGVSGTQLLNINMGGSATITYDTNGVAQTLFANYGTAAMTFTFEFLGGVNNQLRIQATGRDGLETFDQTFDLAGAPDAFRLYASDLAGGDNRQPYFNNFSITAIPEPGSVMLIGLGLVACVVTRRLVG